MKMILFIIAFLAFLVSFRTIPADGSMFPPLVKEVIHFFQTKELGVLYTSFDPQTGKAGAPVISMTLYEILITVGGMLLIIRIAGIINGRIGRSWDDAVHDTERESLRNEAKAQRELEREQREVMRQAKLEADKEKIWEKQLNDRRDFIKFAQKWKKKNEGGNK